ncbi:MAG: substrate-binding domain-containing protein [Acidobacteria bacterium]|nr:substrate-binding domain-containing protein [Acidobacteriota bacterium]
MKKSGLVLLLSMLAAIAMVSACNRTNTGAKKKVIAVIPKGVTNVFWQSVKAGADAAGKEVGVEIYWKGPTIEGDASSQINVVEDAITSRVDGMLIAPSHRDSLVSVVERAQRENIPVTIFDSGIGTEKYVSYVATDNVLGGVMAAERLAERLGGKGKVAVLGLKAGSVSTDERERGFQDTIKQKFPGIQIVAFQYGESSRTISIDRATDILTAHPDLNGFFASNEPSTVGVAQAIKQKGAAGKIILSGFDSSPNLIEDLKAGVIDSLVIQNPYRMGYDGVKSLVDKLNGKTPERRIDTGVKLVTKENLASPEIQQLLGTK